MCHQYTHDVMWPDCAGAGSAAEGLTGGEGDLEDG